MTEQELRSEFFAKTGRIATSEPVEYQAFLWGFTAGAASRDAEIAELIGALEKQVAHDKAVSYERCFDCDYIQKCSRESGCHGIKNHSPIASAALAKVRKP